MIPDDSYKYHVGDLIKIRQVKDIPVVCTFGWNELMADWCGQIFTIATIGKLNGEDFFKFVDMPNEMARWSWSRDMIEPIITPSDIITDSEINELIFSYV